MTSRPLEVTSPQQWRPSPQPTRHEQRPAVPDGQPYIYGYQQQQSPAPQPMYAPPNINVTVSPTMNQTMNVGGTRRRHGFWFHAFMTVITGGFWIFIGPILAMRRRR
ncbi:hypothetical protein GCM10009836_18680 [Pseudonocardia ailaonensis]|uniref:Uncharacterized protein n=1 Tax=Pseudonocardia ailaonensis TaxID=367279 RepID=A0ABN2MWP9_9PSEU